MRILTCLLPLVAVAAAPAGAPPRPCPTAQLSPADQHKPVTVHPLNREPGAKLEIAVQRTDADGCVRPIVVRDNVGGKSR